MTLITMHAVKRWLQCLAIGHIILGLLLPVVVQLDITLPYFMTIAQLFAVPDDNLNVIRFLVGIFGPTVASWGVLFWAVVTHAFSSKTAQSWWLMIAACVVWALYDSVYSCFYGLWLNALLNGLVFLAIVLPLWWVRAEFK